MCNNQCTPFCECVNEHLTNGLHILSQNDKSSQRTPSSPSWNCPRDDSSTCSLRVIKSLVLVFKYPHGWIWPMIVTMQKWFKIFTLLILHHPAASWCSTVSRELCIIAIMCSVGCDQTSPSHQFYYIDYYSDISMNPRMKQPTEEIHNPITETIPNLQAPSHPLQS